MSTEPPRGRAAFIHIYNSFTGAPMVLAQLLQCLAQTSVTGLSPTIITSKTAGPLTGLDAQYSYLSYQFTQGRKLLTFSYWLWAQVEIFFKLLSLRPKLVVVNTIHPFSAIIYALLFRVNNVVYVHEHDFGNKHITDFLFWLVGKSKHQIVVSKTLQRHRKELEGATVIPNCQHISRGKREKQGIRKVGLVSVGDFNKKGVHAFIALSEQFPEIEFILQTGLKPEHLSMVLSSVDPPNNLTARSFTKEMQSFYHEIDLLLNLSNPKFWVETFGLTIIEAQASGIPSIGPNVGGPAEIINEGQDGFLVDPTNVEEVTSKIQLLQANPALYRELCEQAYTNSLNYNQSSYCKRINDFFRAVTA